MTRAARREAVELVRGIRHKINLITLNPGPGSDLIRQGEQQLPAFQNILIKAGIPTFVRRPAKKIFIQHVERDSGLI